MNVSRQLITLLLVALSFIGISQNEFSKWYFGLLAGLNFSTSPPTILTNGIIVTVDGSATIADNAGNLLFSTDGTGVANSNNLIMANGLNITTIVPGTQAAIIVKQPGSNPFYYIFTVGAFGMSAAYSIVDMSLAAGLGSVTVKNATLLASSCEKQVAVRHCNGKDVWIVTHDFGNNQFRSYLLTSAGLSPNPVITPIGESPMGVSDAAMGYLKVSPDGKKLAMAVYGPSIPLSAGGGGFQLFDFNPASGVVSNSLILLSSQGIAGGGGAWGVEFSPDGTKLYGTSLSASFSITSNFYQWNICATTTAAIAASQYSVGFGSSGLSALQWAIDGKIYMSVTGQQSLNVINNPNGSGTAMNFVVGGQSVAPNMCGNGLPNYLRGYAKLASSLFTASVNCQSASFTVPPVPTFSSGCISTPYAPNGYFWDFGDPGTGSANTSTVANPSHVYSAIGTFTASLILLNACVNDTLKKVITISTPGPTPSIAGPESICKGAKYTYTASGGTTYTWFNSSTASTLALAPSTNTVYSVSATSNGCTLSKTFTVTVNPCTGIHTNLNFSPNQYPNPFSNFIKLETSQSGSLKILDITGKQVLESDLIAGENEINTQNLKPGIYTLQVFGASGSSVSKLVKVE